MSAFSIPSSHSFPQHVYPTSQAPPTYPCFTPCFLPAGILLDRRGSNALHQPITEGLKVRAGVRWGRWVFLASNLGLGGDLGNEPVMSAVFATFPAIIIVFNLNDVASLEHTKYVGMLHCNGGFGKRGFRKEGWSGISVVKKNASGTRERVMGI